MRKILIIGALAAVGLLNAQPSQAYYHGRWCAKLDVGGGTVGERCDFPSFETCRRYVNAQPRSFCVQSQYYLPHWRNR